MPSLSSFTNFFSSQPALSASPLVSTYISQHKDFNPSKDSDNSILKECTTKLQTTLAELQTVDTHIIAGFAVGSTAFALSSLLPFGVTMAIAGFGYSAYCIGKREKLAKEYRVALADAVACLKWTVGDLANNTNKAQILASTDVLNLFDTLSPLMNEQQITDAIDDTVEKGFVKRAGEKGQDLFGRPLNKEEKDLFYGIYGYEQGSISDAGKGLWYLACKAINWIFQSVKGLWSHQEAAVVSTTREIPADAELHSNPPNTPTMS